MLDYYCLWLLINYIIVSNNNDRLDRIEAVVESLARSVLAIANDHQQRIHTIENVEAVVQSLARSVEAIANDHGERIQTMEEVVNRVTRVEEGLTRMLIAIDDDRPTILRKLNTIENKLDSLLEGNQNN